MKVDTNLSCDINMSRQPSFYNIFDSRVQSNGTFYQNKNFFRYQDDGIKISRVASTISSGFFRQA